MNSDDIENNLQTESTLDLGSALTTYYVAYQDPTISGVIEDYRDGKLEHITVPPKLQNNGNIWAIVLDKYLEGKSLVSTHAEKGHRADSMLSIRIMREELERSNVSTNVSNPKKYREGKDAEISRLKLQTIDPVERSVERHLHVQMALEIQNQIDNEKIDKVTLKKNLERFAKTNPAFVTLLGCELASLSPIAHKLHFNIDDVLDVVDTFSHNRLSDRTYLYDIYNLIAGMNIFDRNEMEKATEILLQKFPTEKEALKQRASFKDIVKPVIVFESSLNVFIENIFPKKNIQLTDFVMHKLGTLADSVTSHILTAYVEHTPKLTLGPTSAMLTPKTLNRFLSTSFNKPQE